MNKLRTAIATTLLGLALHAPDSSAVLVVANDTERAEWRVGEPAPAINQWADYFTVVACGAELAWVYDNFPTIPKRALTPLSARKTLSTIEPPAESTCVFWRGDAARFIADNLELEVHW
jgi:hypothetical protein